MSDLVQRIRELEVADAARERRAFIASHVDYLESVAADLEHRLIEANAKLDLAAQEVRAEKREASTLRAMQHRLNDFIFQVEESQKRHPKSTVGLAWLLDELKGVRS